LIAQHVNFPQRYAVPSFLHRDCILLQSSSTA
jgi:hypothetical protein